MRKKLWCIVVTAVCLLALCVFFNKVQIPREGMKAVEVDEALENAISSAVILHNKDNFWISGESENTYSTEYHNVLKVENYGETTEVYLISHYAEYQYLDHEIQITGGRRGPCVITFDVDQGKYMMRDYWEPKDGALYRQSILERFPEDLWDINVESLDEGAEEICYQRAVEYFGIE